MTKTKTSAQPQEAQNETSLILLPKKQKMFSATKVDFEAEAYEKLKQQFGSVEMINPTTFKLQKHEVKQDTIIIYDIDTNKIVSVHETEKEVFEHYKAIKVAKISE